MTKFIVTHHAHHPDEGVYRIVVAEAQNIAEHSEGPNPIYDPKEAAKLELTPEERQAWEEEHEESFVIDDAKTKPMIAMFRPAQRLVNHRDIVWADDAPEWKDKTPEQIAAKQRAFAKAALTKVDVPAQDATAARHISEPGTPL